MPEEGKLQTKVSSLYTILYKEIREKINETKRIITSKDNNPMLNVEYKNTKQKLFQFCAENNLKYN